MRRSTKYTLIAVCLVLFGVIAEYALIVGPSDKRAVASGQARDDYRQKMGWDR